MEKNKRKGRENKGEQGRTEGLRDRAKRGSTKEEGRKKTFPFFFILKANTRNKMRLYYYYYIYIKKLFKTLK